MSLSVQWWVYVIQSQKPRFNKTGKQLPGLFYVGSTTNFLRRLRQHNGELGRGAKATAMARPWVPAALYGPYANRKEAFKAEMALKKSKRGRNRTLWSPADSPWCRGLGAKDPWVTGQVPASSPDDPHR